MTRLAPLFAMLIALGLSAPVLAASQSSEQSATQQMENSKGHSQNKMQHPHRIVIGKVTDTRGVQIKGPAGDKHRLLKLNANDNTVIVDLGAMNEQTFKDLGINKGNRIWVLGSSARIDGKPVIFARYVGEVYDFTPKYQGGQSSSQQ